MDYHHFFLSLVKSALWERSLDESEMQYLLEKDWMTLYKIASTQGLPAVFTDGIGKLTQKSSVCKQVLLKEGIPAVIRAETRWMEQLEVTTELAGVFEKKGIKMMLLKGVGLSLYYPVPKHRESGDIDIYLFGKSEEGNAIAEKQFGATVERFNKKEDHIFYNGFSIDNHINFMWIGSKYDRILNNRLIELLQERELESFQDTAALLPPAEFNYLFLLKHSRDHFMRNEMILRQVTDIALFLKKEGSCIDWERIDHILEEVKLKKFSDAILAFVKCYFNLDLNGSCIDKELAERIKNDIFFNSHPVVYHSSTVSQKFYTLKMMWKNRWKYDSLYEGGIFSYLIDKLKK